MSIVIGIDPDSDKNGVAIYRDGVLTDLKMMHLLDLMDYIIALDELPKVALENVLKNKFVYARNRKQSKAAESKVAMSIGRCQQAQAEIERMLERIGVSVTLFPPQKGNWAKHSARFGRITGWTKKSNEDTRAAAFMGYLLLGSYS